MRTAVAIAILLLALGLLALVGYIVARRFVIGLWSGFERARRTVLAAATDAWLVTEPEALPSELRSLLPFPDRRLFVEICLQRLAVADDRTRARLLNWLETHGQIDRWLRQLRRRNPWRRARAAEMLGVARLERSAGPLVEALQDPVFDVRMRAAKALGALGGQAARAALVGALADENRWSVIRISDLLAEMGPAVAAELTQAYPGMARSGRLATLDVIAKVGDASATPFLASLMSDLDRDVRARSASALGRIGDQRADAALRAGLQDSEWPVRAMCAKALARLGTETDLPALRASLRDREWWVRANAAEALGQLGPAGAAELERALDDHDEFARDQALATLEASGDLNRRLAGLVSGSPQEAAAANAVLARLLERQPRDRIRAIVQRHPEAMVRDAIAGALASAAARDGAHS